MDLTILFKNHLIDSGASYATVKNYVADVKRFVRYFESRYSLPFKPELITSEMILTYKTDLVAEIGQRSVNRHISSLRRYFQFTQEIGLSQTNPCLIPEPSEPVTLESEARLKDFKDFLYNNKSSDLTIKNYVIDIKQFLSWFERISQKQYGDVSPKQLVSVIDTTTLALYKERLLRDSDLSISSINRKLSSLRAYFKWAEEKGVLSTASNVLEEPDLDQITNIPQSTPKDPLLSLYEKQYQELHAAEAKNATQKTDKPEYSSFPPIRLAQKGSRLLGLALDFALIAPLAAIGSYCQYIFWTQSGGKVFEAIIQTKPVASLLGKSTKPLSRIKNVKPTFYTPLDSTVKQSPFHKKILFHAANTRPIWYKRYQSIPVVRVVHTGLLLSIIALSVLFGYRSFTTPQTGVLGETYDGSSRTLSFKGTLTNDNGSPLTDTTGMRFSLYKSQTASGEAQLWEEVQYVTPDQNGAFIVDLGLETPIPDRVFITGHKLYVGVSIETNSELRPRQPIANVALAKDSQTLQGLLPSTDPRASSENVLLALDSSGNLTLDTGKSHTFQSTGGTFRLKGQSVILSTLAGTNGNITISPNGSGIIDLQKPIQNSTEDIEIAEHLRGAVLIDDMLAINATGSGRAALSIEQNGFGPLIAASSSGTSRFTVDNIGSTTIGHNLTINGTDIATPRPVFSLLNRNVSIVNFAGESEAVTIGSHSGTTTIRNARTAVSGNLTVSGGIGATFFGDSSGITFSGSGSHTIRATSGNLKIGSDLFITENTSIIPDTANGINNLGSQDKPFDTLYVNNIVSPNLNTTPSQVTDILWNSLAGFMTPKNITNDILLGGTATSSALIKLGGTIGSNSFVNTGGNLGIGTTSPLYSLHVSKEKSSDAVALIENTSTSSNADVLTLKLNTISPSSGNTFINFLDGTASQAGSIRASGSGGVSYLTTGSDFAEYFRKESFNEPLIVGDVVCLGSNGGVTRCDDTYTTIVGVITDRAGFVGAADKADDKRYVLVGLHGQIPVRVLASEHIMPGDSLTLSRTKGISKKLSSQGQIIGRALESSEGRTSILTYVNPSWHDPHVSITDAGNLNIEPIHDDTSETESYLVSDTAGNILWGIGVFRDVVTGSLRTGLLTAKNVIVDGSVTISGSLAAAIISATEISAETITATESLLAQTIKAEAVQSESIVAPVIESEMLKVSILSPVSDDTLTIQLRNKRVDFVNKNTPDTPVAQIDEDGNASFAGTINSSSLNVSNTIQTATISADTLAVSENASVSGTLYAKEIIAEKLKLPQSTIEELMKTLETHVTDEIASLLAQGASPAVISEVLAPVVTEIQNETELSAAENIATPSSDMIAYTDISPSYEESASISAFTQNSEYLLAERLTVNQGLMVFGVTSLHDASVSDLLSIGGNMTIQNGAINTLGTNLEIQPLRQSNVSFMAGRIIIDTDGNAVFNENVTIEGTLFARNIKPLPGENLTFDLDENQSLGVRSASNEASLTINSIGDVIASGSGSFFDIISKNFKVVRGAEADTSSTETIASGSAGVAFIVPGEIERTIVSPYINKDSLIYLTPASETYGMTPYVARQTVLSPTPNPASNTHTSGGSFTIRIQDPLPNPVRVNWWIIN